MIQKLSQYTEDTRQMYIIFRKMEHGHIIWMQMEQQQFRIYRRRKQLFLVGNIPEMAGSKCKAKFCEIN